MKSLFLIIFSTILLCQETSSNPEVKFLKNPQFSYISDQSINVNYYKLELKINYESKKISGIATINLYPLSTISSFYLDLDDNMHVDSVLFGSKAVGFSHLQNKLNIQLNSQFAPPEKVSVTVYYNGNPSLSRYGSFNWDVHNGEPSVWTLSEPYGAQDWFPCKNTPADKADSSEVTITCSNFFTAVSNGNLISVTENPDGTISSKWKNSYPIANYLISIAMSNYKIFTQFYKYSEKDSMPVINYIYPENYNDAIPQLTSTLEALKMFSNLYGPYPWLDEKYGHAQCGFSGGMEHQTIASVGGFSEGLIVHELSHQWFGDKITCKDWKNIWLNEGFATYSEALFREFKYGKQSYNTYINAIMNGGNSNAKKASGSIYLQDTSTFSSIFSTSRTYYKGAVVLHMLRGIVGDSLFFRILKQYATSPNLIYSVAGTEDFQSVAENIYGKSLAYFFNEWIYGENYPKYQVNWSYNDSSNGYTVVLNIKQKNNRQPNFFTMPIEVKISGANGDTLLTVFNDLPNQTFRIEIKSLPYSVQLDPNNKILKDVSFITDTQVNYSAYKYQLSQNYPNPFNPSTKISYFLSKSGDVQIKIFDILGNEVAVLVNKYENFGSHEVVFNPNQYGLSSGTYYYKITADKFTETKKMLLIK